MTSSSQPAAERELATLIVEDEEDDALLLARHLQRHGYKVYRRRVDTRGTLTAALDDRRWDIVLCDYTLPGMTVFEVLGLVRESDPDLPVIVVTGSMGEGELVELVKLGARDIVLKDNLARLKPAVDRELTEAVRRRRDRRTEMLLANAIESASEGLALFDAEDRLVLWNRRYAELFGLAAGAAEPGAAYRSIFEAAVIAGHFDTGRQPPERYIEDHAGPHRHQVPSFEQLLSDGRWLRFEERRTQEGGTIAILSDISERKQREDRLRHQALQLRQANEELQREIKRRKGTETSLRESESRLKTILDGAADGIVTFDREGWIESANSAAEKLFGRTAFDLVGVSVGRLLPQLGWHGEADLAPTGRTRQMMARRADGADVPVELLISETTWGANRIYTAIVRDITERMRLERMKGEFVSVVSHELRTPLTAIKGSLALLQSATLGDLPPRAAPIIDMACRNTERLIKLINDILDIEKIELDKVDFAFQPISLRPMIAAAIRENQAYAEQAGVTLHLADGGGEVTVLADPDRLVQVMTNLLSNAAKFSPAGGRVRVEIVSGDRIVRTSVIDEGEGIPEAAQGEIFEKFVQVDSSDARRRGGTGLGLSIAKAIVERHGGRIGVKSTPGAGATFFFDLPGWDAGALPPADRTLRTDELVMRAAGEGG